MTMQQVISRQELVHEGTTISIIEPSGMQDRLSDLLEYLESYRAEIKSELLRTGAILFRGFAVRSNEDFQQVRDRFAEGSHFSYRDGNSPRTKMAAGIYTSTEYPREYRITLHNEMSYASKWPAHLLFYCHIPAAEGGETPLNDCRALLYRLDPQMVDSFRSHGVRYTRYLNGAGGIGKSWSDTFEMSDKAAIEDYCRDNGIEFFWEKDSLFMAHQGPGLLRHPLTNEEVWFNQANQFHPSSLPREEYMGLKMLFSRNKHKFPHYAYYGNGEDIPEEYLRQVTELQFDLAVKFKWQQGDIVIVDNVLVAHGRMPFEGERKIYVSMC